MSEKVFCYIKDNLLHDKLMRIYQNVNFILCSSKERLLNFCRRNESSIVLVEDELDLLSRVKYYSNIYAIYFTQNNDHYLEAIKLRADDVIHDYSEESLEAIRLRFYYCRPFNRTVVDINVDGNPLIFSTQEIYVVEMRNRKVTLYTYYGTYSLVLHAFRKDKKFLYNHHFRQVRKGIYVNLMQIRSFKNNVVLMGNNSSYHLTRTYKRDFERDYEEVRAGLMVKNR